MGREGAESRKIYKSEDLPIRHNNQFTLEKTDYIGLSINQGTIPNLIICEVGIFLLITPGVELVKIKINKSIIRCFLTVLLMLTACWANAATFPQRVVSLGPALTEELLLLGLGDAIVGVTTYCVIPEEKKDIVRVGTITDIDLEKIVALNPDLVLATALTNAQQVKKLRSLDIRVISLPYYNSYQHICEEFISLGEITGRKEQAEEIVTREKKKVATIVQMTKALPRLKVFLQVGSDPLFTVSNKSFVNDFIVLAGGINIAAESGVGMYSREEVIKRDPDIIIVTAMGITGEKEKRKWQRFNSINAVKNNRIYIIDPYRIGSPTPETFVDTLEEIVVMLYPETEIKS